MSKKIIYYSAGLILVLGFCGCSTAGIAIPEKKPVILIAAFGSSYKSGQANLNDFDQALVRAFPGYDIRWAFTASFIVNKLHSQGVATVFERQVKLEGLDEALQRLREEGHTKVLIQSLHLMVGAEFREVLEADTSGLNVKYAYPLLFNAENIEKVIVALEDEIASSPTAATVFCAHGNAAHPEYNAQLVEIDNYLRTHYRNTYLAVMEGNPGFTPVKETILANGSEKIKFVTFMLTYGDHMSNDVMGAEEDSMKSQLGLPAECSNGLASHPQIQAAFIDNMRLVLNQFE